jgi:hypothetical protein
MDPETLKINRILKERLIEIYNTEYIKSQIQSIMKYPLKENLYVVTYDLDLQNTEPILRAKIVVDLLTEELREYNPVLL